MQPGAFDCMKAALPDEPYFVLLARDPSAPAMLGTWVAQRRKDVFAKADDNEAVPLPDDLAEDLRKCTEAETCAFEMTIWRRRNGHAPWRDQPSERRIARTEPTPAMMAAVAEAVIKGVGVMAGIPSQYQGSISIDMHEARPWRSTMFNGAVHILRVRAADRFGDVIAKDLVPQVADMPIGGQLVADVDMLGGDADAITLTVSTVYDE